MARLPSLLKKMPLAISVCTVRAISLPAGYSQIRTPNSGSSMRPPTNCSSSRFHRLARFPLWAVLLARADEVIE